MIQINNLQKGFSTLDIVLAMVIIITVLTSVILVVFSNQTIAVDTKINGLALSEAKNIIENAKIQSRLNFNSAISFSSFDGIYNKKLFINDINPCRKDAKSILSWAVDPSRPGDISLETVLLNVPAASSLAGDCGPDTPETNWQNVICSQNGFDFPSNDLKSTGIDFVRHGQNNYAVLTSTGSTANHDLWLINVNNTSSPIKTSSINTGSSPNDIDVASNYAFIANNTSSGQLQIVDITDTASLGIIASRSLPGIGNPFPQAKKIFYYNNRVYIGTLATSGYEFYIFDVSNPGNPLYLGGYELGESVRDLVIRSERISNSTKTLAYLASSASSTSSPELVVLDVSNPSSITQIGTFNAPSATDSTALYVLGNYVYLGRKGGSGAGDFYILDVSNKAQINLLDTLALGLSPGDKVEKIIASGGLAFVATSSGAVSLAVLNVADPLDINQVSSCNYSQKIVDFDFDGRYIYIANNDKNGLRIANDNF